MNAARCHILRLDGGEVVHCDGTVSVPGVVGRMAYSSPGTGKRCVMAVSPRAWDPKLTRDGAAMWTGSVSDDEEAGNRLWRAVAPKTYRALEQARSVLAESEKRFESVLDNLRGYSGLGALELDDRVRLDGETLGFSRHTPFAEHEYEVWLDSGELSGTVVEYGEWRDLTSEELDEIAIDMLIFAGVDDVRVAFDAIAKAMREAAGKGAAHVRQEIRV